MFKDIAIKITIIVCVFITNSTYADDSDLYPEPVPVDQQPVREQADSHAQLGDQLPKNDQDSPQLTAQEENIIGQDQAQFEEEQNTLRPDHIRDAYFKNKEHDQRVLQRDDERNKNDIQKNGHYNAEVDQLKINEDERILMHDHAETREDSRNIVNDRNMQRSQRMQAQQNMKKFQQQKTNRSGGADW